MIRRQYYTGSGDTFPFRIRENGVLVALSNYIINFKGQGNHTASVLSYHLSASSASATQIDVPYSSIVQSANVVRGQFFVTGADGIVQPVNEPLHITIR